MTAPTRLDLADADIVYFRDAFTAAEAAAHLEALLDGIDWRSERISLFGRRVRVPRLTYWVGDAAYSYSGLTHEPAPWPDVVAPVRARAEEIAGQRFNGVLLNLYRDGADSMGWHADDEPELGPRPVIASVSFGAVRRFRLKRKDRGGETVSVDLEPGSLRLMGGTTQRHWLHEVPKTKRPVGPRVNLTFRRIVG